MSSRSMLEATSATKTPHHLKTSRLKPLQQRYVVQLGLEMLS